MKLPTEKWSRHRGGASANLTNGPCGFSLLEMIAVLSMISIFAAIVVPPLIQQIDREERDEEGSRLTQLASGLRNYVESEHSIPTSSNWGTELAEYVDFNASEVTENSRNNLRRYLMHPGLASNLSALQSTNGLASNPDFARLILLSSIHEPLPSGDIVTSKSDFENLWDWSSQSENLPSRLMDMGWQGSVADLIIKKVNFNGDFKRLKLRKVGGEDAGYKINGYAGTIGSGSGVDGYFPEGSRLVLEDTDGNRVAEEILRKAESYFLKWGTWYSKFPGTYDPRKGAPQWMQDQMNNLSDWIETQNVGAGDLKFQMHSHGNKQMYKLMAPGN